MPNESSTPDLFAATGLHREALAQQVARHLMRLVVEGRLQPGQKLPNERELAKSLGVGRPTLREALNALQMMNVVTIRHGGATQVADLSPESLIEPFELMCSVGTLSAEDVMEVRASLEAGVARLAAERASDEALDEIAAMAEAAAAQIDDPVAFMEADVRFHGLILEAAQNPMFASLMAAVARLGRASREKTVRVRAIREATLGEHRAIVEALKRRDPDMAAAAMVQHMRSVIAGYRRDGRRHGSTTRKAG